MTDTAVALDHWDALCSRSCQPPTCTPFCCRQYPNSGTKSRRIYTDGSEKYQILWASSCP